MATSKFETTQYSAENFVESAGAIIFKLSTKEVCLVHHVKKNEWLLAKGRRNVSESRQTAAIREAAEETGYRCRLLPATMTTRTPPAVETGHYPDEPRVHEDVCEPFMVTCRQLQGGANLKLIWWFLGAIDEQATSVGGESQFRAQWFDFTKALNILTFEPDREILRKAIEIFGHTYGDRNASN